MTKELLIHFTDYKVITSKMKRDLGINCDKEDLNLIISLCDNIEQLKMFLNKEELINVCFKASNYLIRNLECKHNVKIKRYPKLEFEIDCVINEIQYECMQQ